MQPVIMIEWTGVGSRKYTDSRYFWEYGLRAMQRGDAKSVWLKYPHHNATDQVHF